MKRKNILIVGVVVTVLAGLATLFINKGPTPTNTWPLDDTKSVYTIHGVTNFDRGSTYYLYRQHGDNRDVALIDPASPVDFMHSTDRPVRINGSFVKNKNGQTQVRITYIQLIR